MAVETTEAGDGTLGWSTFLTIPNPELEILLGAAARVYRNAKTPNEETLAYLLMRVLGAPASYGEDKPNLDG